MNNISVFYCKASEAPPGSSHRLAPAPTVSISPETYYANDNVIGYTYNITLSGYANALRLDLNAGSTNYGLEPTVEHIGHIREVFNTNGGNLYIKQGNSNIIVAKGGTIKNIKFDQSNNHWVNYAPYTVELEFNEVDFIGCSGNPITACSGSIFHTPNITGNVVADNLVDIKKYKIKEFSDKWSMTIDNDVYDNYGNQINSIFRVNYSLSATGKNYYIDGNLIPAYQQAKLFAQDKLYNQVKALIDGILPITSGNLDGCSPDRGIDTLHKVDNESPTDSGLLSGFNTLKDECTSAPTYDVYNETISCDTSEADGTFSVTYDAILKNYDSSLSPSENATIHKYTKNTSITEDSAQNVTITAQGTIQGLIRGGFIYYNNDYILPASGTFVAAIDTAETKYSNALNYFDARVRSGDDLNPTMKTLLNITKQELLIKNATGYPMSSSFVVEHNYTAGSIGWTANYDKQQAQNQGQGYTNISIVRNDPVDLIQEFVIPGRLAGPIIQKLNTKTPRTIAINIEGANQSNKKCEYLSGIDICNSLPSVYIQGLGDILAPSIDWVKTKEDYTTNHVDGSFSISLEFQCKG